MIKIVKEKSEKYVTKGAYENFYKPLGYSIANDGNKEHKDEKIKKSKENVVKDNEYKGEKKSQKFEEFKKR